MASSQSTINRYDNINFFRQENLPMLAQQLTMKQGVVDQTKMMLDNLQTELGINLDLARDEDKAYLQQRLSQATGIVNNALSRGADISDPTISRMLFNQMKEVVNDQNILNAVVSTKKVRQLQSEMEWYRTNNPAKYSEINASVAGKGIIKYLNSEGIGQIYSGGEYTPYVNIQEKLMNSDVNKQLKDMGINAEYVTTQNGNGYFRVDNKYKGTADPERLKMAIQAIIGEDGFRQMAIESEYYTGDGDNLDAVDAVRQQYDLNNNRDLEIYKNQLDAVKTAYSATSDKNEKERLQKNMDALQKKVDGIGEIDFNSLITNQDGFIDSQKFKNIANNLYSNGKVNQWFSLLYQDPLLKESKVNELDYKTRTFEQKIREFEYKVSQDRISNDLAERKFQLEIAKAEKSGVFGLNSSNNGLTVETDYTEITTEESKDFNNIILKEFRSAINDVIPLFGEFNVGITSELGAKLTADPNWKDGESIIVGGQTIKLTPETKITLQKFQDAFNGQGGYLSQAKTELSTYFNTSVDAVYDAFLRGGDDRQSVYDFARRTTNGYFNKVGEDEYVWTDGLIPNNKNGMSNVSYLLHKKENKGLTKDEEMTLKTLILPSIMKNDNRMSTADRQIMLRAFQDEVNSNLGIKATTSLPTYKTLRGSKTSYDKEAKPIQGEDLNVWEFIGAIVSGSGATSSRGGWDRGGANLYDYGDINTIRGYKGINSRAFEKYDLITNTLVNQTGNLRLNDFRLTKDNPNHKVITTSVKGLTSDYKGDLTLESIPGDDNNFYVQKQTPVYKEGTATKIGEEMKRVNVNGADVKISKSLLKGVNFDSQKKTPYDSSLDNYAVIDLGKSVVNTGVIGSSNNNAFISTTNEMKKQLQTEELKNMFQSYVDAYLNGDIEFKIAPLQKGGNYVMSMEIPSMGVDVGIRDFGVTRLHYGSDIDNIIVNSNALKQTEFIATLNNIFQLR